MSSRQEKRERKKELTAKDAKDIGSDDRQQTTEDSKKILTADGPARLALLAWRADADDRRRRIVS